jgi:hypothetical protein
MELDAEDFSDDQSCISILVPLPLDAREGDFEMDGKVSAEEHLL